MCDVGLLVSQSHRPYKSLHLDWLPRETLTNESCFRDHAFPRFALALSGLHHLEHLILRNTPHSRQWHREFSSLVLSLLLDRR